MNKKFLLCSWGLITALLTNFAFGQNDIYNSFTDYTGDILHGNHVKKTTLANNEGYYVGGIVDGGTEAFVAKTDRYGNTYWIKHITGLASQEAVMEIVDDILYFAVREHNGVVAYAFEHDGSMHGNFPILLAHASYPDIEGIPLAIKPFYSGTSSDLRIGVLMSDIGTGPDLILWAFETDGTIDFIRRYDAPAWNQTNVAATFVQKNNTNRDLCVVYGTDHTVSSVSTFEVVSTSGALIVTTSPPPVSFITLHKTEIVDASSHVGDIAIHDALILGNDIVFVGAFNHEPIIGNLDANTNHVVWVDLISSVYSSPENHAVFLTTDIAHFYVMTSGFNGSPHPNPESMQMHKLELDFITPPYGIISTSSTDMRLPTPFNYRAKTSYPASFDMDFNGHFPAFTSHVTNNQYGTPFYILDNNMDLNCPVTLYSISTIPPNYFVNPLSSIFTGHTIYNNQTPVTDPPANKIPRPEHQCLTCSPGLMVDIDVTGAICGGGTATLTANIVTAIANPIYIWYPNGESTSSIQVTTAGTYTLLVIDPDGGCYEMSSVNINDNSSWHAHSENSNNTTVVDVEKDDQNNIYIIGTFEGIADFEGVTIGSGASPTGAYIAKYNLCGELQWVACTEDTDPVSYRGVDLEFRNGNLHFMIGFDQSGSQTATLEVYDANSSILFPGGIDLHRNFGSYIIGSLSPDGTSTPTLVSYVDLTMGTSDSLRALDFFDNGTDEVYLVAGRQGGHAYIAELEIVPAASPNPAYYFVPTSSPNRISSGTGNNIDMVNDIELYIDPLTSINYLYATGKYVSTGFFGGNLPAASSSFNAFAVKLYAASLNNGVVNIPFVDFYNSHAGSTGSFAEGIEIDIRSNNNIPEVFVIGNFEGNLTNWSASSGVPNAFITMLGEVPINASPAIPPLMFHRWTNHFVDNSQITYAKGTGIIVDDAFNRVHAVGVYKADVLELLSGDNIGGDLNYQWMWNVCFNINNGTDRWINGGHYNDDVEVSGVAAFNENAYVGGSYRMDLQLLNHVVTSAIPYVGSSPNQEAFLARYGELGGANGPYYKNGSTELSNIENQNSETFFSVFPNPTKDKVTIQLNGNLQENWSYSLYNLMGAEISSRSNISHTQNQETILLNNLPTGIYLVKISQDNKHSTSKLLVH